MLPPSGVADAGPRYSAALLSLLACPKCSSRLRGEDARELVCASCGSRYPIVNGIPRFVAVADTDTGRRTQESFGYEWTEFNDPGPSGETNFQDYFAEFDTASLAGKTVLDAGCGMGRHARKLAHYAGRLVAADFSAAIDQAARNTASIPNVHCIQADLTRLPLRDEAFDFVYSLGVLHHIADTGGTLKALVQKLKPGGRIRVYLYWKRTGLVGLLVALVSAARLVTTRLPFSLLKLLCLAVSAALWIAVLTPYRTATALGLTGIETWPLLVYTKYPFNALYNDQFDRFSAPLEKRYSPAEVRALLASTGLENISVRSCYGWIADGTRPAGR